MAEETEKPKVGIKETKEFALGAIALGFYLTKLMKDGFQIQDVQAFMKRLGEDPVFAEKLKVAADGMMKMGEEIKDLDMYESIELAGAAGSAVIAEITAPALVA